MFRKIRFKFICISTLSVLIVLFLVLGLVNLITHKNALSEIYNTVEFISKQGGNLVPDSELDPTYNGKFSAETQYETRYLFITIGKDGVYLSINDDHIAAVNSDNLGEFISFALDSEDERGLFEYRGRDYAYLRVRTAENTSLTIMDCTRTMSAVEFFEKFSFYIGFLSTLLMILILSILSRRIVHPYIKNAEAQKQFITNASHELKTPLAVISANTEVIEMMNGKSEWTESTVKQVNRMSELISQLVVLSRLEESVDLVLTDVNMSEEAKKSIENYKTVADTKGLTLNSEIADDICVSADEKGIFELINILLDNAVKYCDENGEIKITLDKKGRNAVLKVENDYAEGDGVDYKRFFDRFYREDQSHNSEKKGYGIGLSMAESLVRMFKGKIHVSYKKPKICFTITI